MKKIENIEIYSKLEAINVNNIKEKENKFLVFLGKTKLQFNYYKNVIKASESIDECFENLIIEEKYFDELIELSIMLNKFHKLVEKCMDRKEVLSIKNYRFNTKLFYIYYCWKKYNELFNLKELIDLSDSNVKKSLLWYVISLIIENKEEKINYLKVSYNCCNANLASAKDLIFNNSNILTSETIEMLLQLDKSLISKIKPNKNVDKNFKIKFLPLGGGDDIGASCYFLQLEENNILIDCGIKFLGETKVYIDFELLEKVCPIEKINMLIITHAHLDHCGGMLKLLRLNPSIKVLMSEATRDLIRINMKSLINPLEEAYELDHILNNAIIIDFRKQIDFNCTGVKIEFFRAGHILGATSIYINYKGYGIFITGDYCLHYQNTIEGMDVPKGYSIDLLITENTYGNRKKQNIRTKKEIYDELKYYVFKKINEGKKILIPSFAIGRAQELIMILKDIAREHNFRLYVDGMAKGISEIYEKHTEVKFRENNIFFVNKHIYDKKIDFIEQEFMDNRSCVITSSGMLQEGSCAIEYVKKIIDSEDGVCILTGYQADNTIGAKLKVQMELGEKRYINIDEKIYKVKCELIEFNLSAHCSNEEILALIYEVKPKNIILIHGKATEEKTLINKFLSENKEFNVYQSKNKEVIVI